MGVGALWAAAAALCALAGEALVTAESKGEHEFGGDEDSDSAPFMVVLQHGDMYSCGGSLVSPRTVLTSAWCARGGEPGAPALWALAPAAPGAPAARRRVVRAALALGEPLRPGWLGAAGDIAVLELEGPFDSDAGSRPILTAGAPDDCGPGAVCHVVRARGLPTRLRIVDARRAPGDDTCGAVASGWPALRDSALCFAGPTLCSMDRGAGVVCDGQLCGVLSRSARSEAWRGAAPADEDASCGDVHVALSVARYRRFLHCAHILRACGREDGECAHQCTERRLVASSETMFARTGWPGEDAPSGNSPSGDIPSENAQSGDAPSAVSASYDAPSKVTPGGNAPSGDFASSGEIPASNPPSGRAASGDVPNDIELRNSLTKDTYLPAARIDPTRTTLQQYGNLSTTWQPMIRIRTTAAARTTRPAPTTPTAPSSTPTRPFFEFEPNRADFKAGEYGDNAADYGAVEEVAAGPRDGGGDPAPSAAADPAPKSRGVPEATSRADPAPPGHAADATQSGSADSALTWRAGPAPRARANHTEAGAPAPEDMQRAPAPRQPRAAAACVRTRSFVTFVFATITLLVTN